MKIKILGCNGGIGGPHMRTTSMLIDNDVLIDAGTGIMDLEIAELTAINHVFLTHSHLDHIAALPMMLDTVAERRHTPLIVHATRETIEILRMHIFNWLIWPDFSKIPSDQKPSLCYAEISPGELIDLGHGRHITPLPADHTVPAVGYKLDSGKSALIFSGDTGSCPAFWQILRETDNLRYLIIECAFPNSEAALAEISKHYSPHKLLKDLKTLERKCEIFVMHLKPGMEEFIWNEIAGEAEDHLPKMLKKNMIFEF